MGKDVILTGLRSNSNFHIGNYLGGIKPMVDLQRSLGSSHQFNMFVPDLHSFTTPIDHGRLYQQSIENIKFYIASGIDISKPNTYIYRQSYISAHSELNWILGCFTYVGELSRMTQYKDKASNNSSAALFNYPVLMAADILLYDAKWIPLGEDQKQHLELARDIAIRFNNKFNGGFTIPEPWNKQQEFSGRDQSIRVRSLRNPEKKMSKSIDDPNGTILLTDNPSDAVKKIMSATTDSLKNISFDWVNQPGISNLLQILSLATGRSLETVIKEWSGKSNYADLKHAVAQVIEELLTELQNSLSEVEDSHVLDHLLKSEEVMRQVANNKLHVIQQKVGLRP